MATFTITNHDLLSDDAAALDADVLEAQLEVAEGVLKLSGLTFTGEDLKQAHVALVRQVNLQVAQGVDAGGGRLISDRKGNQEKRWSSPGSGSGNAMIDALAAIIAAELIRDNAWGDPVRSFR